MKQIFSFIILLYNYSVIAQVDKHDYKYRNFDSVVVQTYNDNTHVSDFMTGESGTIIITGQAAIKAEDAKTLCKLLRRRESYGQSQAMTPVYDLNIKFYKHGKVIEKVEISLWTNNLFATFPLRVQRQGECMCKGNGGYCCSEGGISISFKKYILDLLQKYDLPSLRDEILDFGQ